MTKKLIPRFTEDNFSKNIHLYTRKMYADKLNSYRVLDNYKILDEDYQEGVELPKRVQHWVGPAFRIVDCNNSFVGTLRAYNPANGYNIRWCAYIPEWSKYIFTAGRGRLVTPEAALAMLFYERFR